MSRSLLQQVLIVAPLGRDAQALASMLDKARMPNRICDGLARCCESIRESTGALLLTAEALDQGGILHLGKTLETQPAWSDLPLLILTTRKGEAPPSLSLVLDSIPTGSVILLERPMRQKTLINALQVALRSRQRQYQVRDLLQKLQDHGQRQQGIYELVDALGRAGSVAEVYEGALNCILAVMHADRASILLSDRENVMRFVASRGLSESYRKAVDGHSPWKPDEPDPQTLWVNDVATAALPESLRPVIEREGIAAMAFIPLRYHQRLLGKFMVYYDSPHEFSAEEVQLMQSIATELAVGLERKRVEVAVRESEERFRILADTSPAPVWSLGAGGDLEFVSQGYLKFFGQSAEQARGSGWHKVVHPDDVMAYVSELTEATRLQRPFRAQARVRRADGEWRWIDSHAMPRFSPAGDYLGMIGSSADVTELKQARDDLASSNEELEERVRERTAQLTEAVRELESWSYSIAHDMRSPLRAMQGYAMLLGQEYTEQLDAEGQNYLKRIATGADRLDRMILDVLNYSNIVRGDHPLEAINTQELIEGILATYPNLQPPHADIRIEGPLPPVLGNEGSLTQMVSNLLGNAVKFVPAGTLPKAIVRAEQDKDWVCLWFEDNGIGIEKESQERIFQMFQRLNRPEHYEGTGMGLAIVSKAVQRMGGSVGVESELGSGSRFWVRLKRPQK